MSARAYKQSPGGFFTITNALTAIGTGTAGGPFLTNAGTETAPSLSTNVHSVSSFTSTLLGTGNILKDMTKTLVSSGRVFRKVQIVVAGLGGVAGVTGTGPGLGANPDYYTGYVEVPSADGLTATGNSATTQMRANIIRLS
jgi:hypothetical protein